MAKVALQAVLCYNEDLIRFCRSVAANNLRRDDRKLSFYRMDTIPQKVCTACLNPFPATLEYFHASGKGRLQTQCKVCRNKNSSIQRKVWRQRPDVKAKLAAANYAYNNNPETREKILARRKELSQRPEAQAKIIAYQKEYRKTYRRPDAKAKHRIHQHNRRARLQAIPGSHTLEESKQQYKRQKGKCYYCQSKVKWGEHHEDHIIPMFREGATNDISNIAITCVTCNLRKNDRLPHEFFEGGRLL